MASLRKRVDAVMVNRQAAFSDARSLLERSVDDYYEDRRSRQAASVVSELRRALEEQRQVELDRRASQIEALSPENRELIDAITSGVIAKIAHRPTMVLKESAGSEKGERLSEAVRQLFDLNTESSE
jgi:glutamyl-tRNA reductase